MGKGNENNRNKPVYSSQELETAKGQMKRKIYLHGGSSSNAKQSTGRDMQVGSG